MSEQNFDEFDDLDDYLEDPSKLDEEQNETTPEGDEKSKERDEDEDPEVTEMMEDLQKQFESLMQQDGNQADKETVQNFEALLNVLGDASKNKDSVSMKQMKKEMQSGDEFKSIVSNTLDRLKENSNKVDEALEQEKKTQNSDDILSQLLDQLVESGEGDDGEGMDNAILKMLAQMSSKEVLYQPMKQMQLEFTEWLEQNENDPDHEEKIPTYKKQFELVNDIIRIYERDDYTNEQYHGQLADLLDDLEQLGDSPVAKGFNNSDAGNSMQELTKMLEIEGDENLGNIDQELQDTCKQQ